MKRLQLIMLSAVMSATLFTACRKDDSMNVAPGVTSNRNVSGSVQTNSGVVGDPVLTYTLQSFDSVSQNNLIQWNTGYLTVGSIFFDGNYQNGDDIIKKNYVAPVNQKVYLFMPPIVGKGASTLGTLNVPGGTIYDPLFGINLFSSPYMPERVAQQAVNVPGTQSTALFLSGSYNGTNQDIGSINITVTINQPISLMASGNNPLTMFDPQQSYTSALFFNLDQLTTGMNQQMLNNAARVNNTITISANSNANLYQVILNNLQNSLQVNFSPSTAQPLP